MVTFFKICKNSIGFIDITSVETVSHSLIVLEVFITFDNLHFYQAELVGGAAAQHAEILAYFF